MITPKKPPYAGTKKDPDASILDINRMLRSYGVNDIQWTTMWDQGQVVLKMAIQREAGKTVVVKVTPPMFIAKRKTWNAKLGKYEIVDAANWSQSMRLMYWWLKLKIESISFGLREVEEEFLHDIVVKLPDGREGTVGEIVRPAIESGRINQWKLEEGE